ncbi:MAG: MarR family winged helix-turn-helix transcriptional regulator [Solirubrobacteraceae bacterium]
MTATRPRSSAQPDDAAAGGISPALAAQPGFLLRVAAVEAERRWAEALPAGLTPRLHLVLASVAASGPSSQQQLADRLSINRTVMVSVVDELEGKGLLERSRNPADRRSYALAITAAGRRALARMDRATERADASLMALLGTEQDEQLATRLGAIAGVDPASSGPGLDHHIVFLLHAAHARVRERFEEHLQPLGLTPALFGPLRTLQASGPTSQQRIANLLGFSAAAIQQTFDRLQADGLIERRRNPADRRSYALQLTPAGHEAIRRAATAQNELADELLGDPHAQQQLTTLLLPIINAAQTETQSTDA